MKKLVFLLVVALTFLSCKKQDNTAFVNKALNYCAEQTKCSLKELKGDSILDFTMMPRNILKGQTKWNCFKVNKKEWTGGFWPGVLWYDYEYTKDESIRDMADSYTQSLAFLAHIPVYDHDLGFLVFCSFGNGYRLTKDDEYKRVIIDAADSLATLFNPKVGTILSWSRVVKEMGWPHCTIIDNMMNLEILFWASKHGGNKNLYDIAVSHANVTMKNQFRPDYSCYHVAVYDTIKGNYKNVTKFKFSSILV